MLKEENICQISVLLNFANGQAGATRDREAAPISGEGAFAKGADKEADKEADV